jgi:hypothetical protein
LLHRISALLPHYLLVSLLYCLSVQLSCCVTAPLCPCSTVHCLSVPLPKFLSVAPRVSPHICFEANIANLEANIFKRNSELKG